MRLKTPEILETDDGPMAEGSSPELLRELLREYEIVLGQRGAPVAEYLLPGLTPDVIRYQLEAVGLDAPEEVIEWFGWHNGVKRDVGGQGRRILPRFQPASLADAVDRYRWSVLEQPSAPEIGDDILYWGVGKGWLRLAASNYGCAVDCSKGGSGPAWIRYANPELELTPGRFRAVSLCTLVTWWIEGLQSGAYVWDSYAGAWNVDESALPRTQLEALFA